MRPGLRKIAVKKGVDLFLLGWPAKALKTRHKSLQKCRKNPLKRPNCRANKKYNTLCALDNFAKINLPITDEFPVISHN